MSFKMPNFMPAAPDAPEYRPLYNTGTFMDIFTGCYVKTSRGNHLLNGGIGYVFSVVGPGNCFKTDEILFPVFLVLAYNKRARCIIYDTENSLTTERIYRIAARCGMTIEQLGLNGDDPLVRLIQAADIIGDNFVELIRNMREMKIAARKAIEVKMPFRDTHGAHYKVMPPTFVPFDSLSAFTTSTIQADTVESNKIGESGANTQFMRDGAAKTQLILNFLNLTVSADIFVPMTAHVGGTIEMGMYAPKPAKLTFQSNGKKMKGVPEKFSFINNYLMEITSSSLCVGDDKAPKFPLSAVDKIKGNDLLEVTGIATRNKSGPSGVISTCIFSQSAGMCYELQIINYLREVGKKMGRDGAGFGLRGNLQTYELVFLPGVKMGRTTVRAAIEGVRERFQPLVLTQHLLQVKQAWRGYEEWFLEPEEIYEKIIALGYDWDKLMNTRFYWVYEEEMDRVGELPELSARDLCEIAHGRYHPYFLAEDKKSYIEGCFDEDGRLTQKGFKKGL